MKHLLLLKTGSAFDEIVTDHGDFDQLFIAALGDSPVTVDTIDARHEALPALDNYQGVLITGSHHMVTDHEAWSDALLPYIREMAQRNLPVLGVCYGHQLLAEALGGSAGYHPEGAEIGTVAVSLSEAGQQDPLLGQLPSPFSAHVTHSQSALTLPDNATLLAYNSYEPHQAFRVNSNIWGVQFHPEFTAAVNRIYLDKQQDKLIALGRDVDQLRTGIHETELCNRLIRRFADLI